MLKIVSSVPTKLEIGLFEEDGVIFFFSEIYSDINIATPTFFYSVLT